MIWFVRSCKLLTALLFAFKYSTGSWELKVIDLFELAAQACLTRKIFSTKLDYINQLEPDADLGQFVKLLSPI
jgi:hypothetical protein